MASVWQLGCGPRHQKDLVPTGKSLDSSLHVFGGVRGCWAKAQPTEVRVFAVASVWQLGRDPRHQKDLVPTRAVIWFSQGGRRVIAV